MGMAEYVGIFFVFKNFGKLKKMRISFVKSPLPVKININRLYLALIWKNKADLRGVNEKSFGNLNQSFSCPGSTNYKSEYSKIMEQHWCLCVQGARRPLAPYPAFEKL